MPASHGMTRNFVDGKVDLGQAFAGPWDHAEGSRINSSASFPAGLCCRSAITLVADRQALVM